ncbi:MAG: histidine phosphatase family protein [Clostridia bacterium]|nr:histidine phosphatase family protein [Clostridia bacterium]
MLLFYIRHGDPIYNPDSLTPQGEQQAQALAKRLARHGLDRVYVSSSNRAILTAKPTCELVKKEMTVLDWCNESHAWRDLAITLDGRTDWCFQHRSIREIMVSNEVRVLGREWYKHPAFADTSYEAGMTRIQRECDALLLSLGYRHDLEKNGYYAEHPNHERVALFAHHGFGEAFLSCLLDIPYPEMAIRTDIGHTGMTVINFQNNDGLIIPRMLQFSNDSHIYAEGLPTKYCNSIYF